MINATPIEEGSDLEFGLWVESAPPEYQHLILERLRQLDAECGTRYARRFVQTPHGLHFIRQV